MVTRVSRRKVLAVAAAICMPSVHVRAASIVRLVVPFAAGGSVDILARLLGRYLTEQTGQHFVVENKSGAGGNIAFTSVAQSEPDGQTWLVASETFVVNPSFMHAVPYDPVKDFKPVMLIAGLSQVLFANKDSELRDLASFVDIARQEAKGLNIATQGTGSPGHFAIALMAQHGLKLVSVPHRGGGPAVQAVVAGNVPAAITTLPAAIALINEKVLRPVAVSTRARSSFLPEIPSLNERLPGTIIDGWQAIFAPAGTPDDIVQRMNSQLAAIIKQPEVRDALLKQCFEPVAGTPAELGDTMRSDLELWRGIVEKTNIRAG
jgi:tripartite-type tricarboxylate transporter receptor subunit TctC